MSNPVYELLDAHAESVDDVRVAVIFDSDITDEKLCLEAASHYLIANSLLEQARQHLKLASEAARKSPVLFKELPCPKKLTPKKRKPPTKRSK